MPNAELKQWQTYSYVCMCAEVVEETDYGSDELRDVTVEQTDLRIQSVSNRDL